MKVNATIQERKTVDVQLVVTMTEDEARALHDELGRSQGGTLYDIFDKLDDLLKEKGLVR